VGPRFGVQSFVSEMRAKVSVVRDEREKTQLRLVIEVDSASPDATSRGHRFPLRLPTGRRMISAAAARSTSLQHATRPPVA
jgi:D-serine deaminase-like pyridoxal phosphate-dependent protein